MSLTNETYVDHAEQVMKKLCQLDPKKLLTTSKIRKILSMISDIYNDARHIQGETLDSGMIGRVQYLKMHIAYEAGREQSVRTFVEDAGLLKEIDQIGNSKEKLILFCHYMEALVAFRKFYGPKEKD